MDQKPITLWERTEIEGGVDEYILPFIGLLGRLVMAIGSQEDHSLRKGREHLFHNHYQCYVLSLLTTYKFKNYYHFFILDVIK